MGIEKVIRDADVAYYYPSTVSPSKEFKTLAAVENPEYKAVWELVWKWFCNTFVYDLDADGATRWEQMLSLPIRHSADLEDRRAAILAKINHTLPYTERSFQKMLNDNYGEGMVEAQCDYDKYELELIFTEVGQAYIKKALRFTRIIIPANLDIISRLIASQIYGVKHSLDATINVTADQGYWLDTTYIPQYWKGYHVPDGEGPQLTGKWQLNGTVQLNGTFTKHRHKWTGDTKFDGREWLDSRGNNQKHEVEISSVVETKQSGNKMGVKLDGSRRLNGTWRLEGAKTLLYGHSATVTIIKGDTVITEAI